MHIGLTAIEVGKLLTHPELTPLTYILERVRKKIPDASK